MFLDARAAFVLVTATFPALSNAQAHVGQVLHVSPGPDRAFVATRHSDSFSLTSVERSGKSVSVKAEGWLNQAVGLPGTDVMLTSSSVGSEVTTTLWRDLRRVQQLEGGPISVDVAKSAEKGLVVTDSGDGNLVFSIFGAQAQTERVAVFPTVAFGGSGPPAFGLSQDGSLVFQRADPILGKQRSVSYFALEKPTALATIRLDHPVEDIEFADASTYAVASGGGLHVFANGSLQWSSIPPGPGFYLDDVQLSENVVLAKSSGTGAFRLHDLAGELLLQWAPGLMESKASLGSVVPQMREANAVDAQLHGRHLTLGTHSRANVLVLDTQHLNSPPRSTRAQCEVPFFQYEWCLEPADNAVRGAPLYGPRPPSWRQRISCRSVGTRALPGEVEPRMPTASLRPLAHSLPRHPSWMHRVSARGHPPCAPDPRRCANFLAHMHKQRAHGEFPLATPVTLVNTPAPTL